MRIDCSPPQTRGVFIMFKSIVFLVMLIVFVSPAYSLVMFEDNFDSENGGIESLSYNAFSNWTVRDGTSVDLIKSPSWFSQPLDLTNRGSFVDMDGTSGSSGRITTKQRFFFEAGTEYQLSFDLAGNNRSAGSDKLRSITTAIGISSTSHAAETFTLNENDDFTPYVISFMGLGVDGRVTFRTDGLNNAPNDNDNMGILLDNVKLIRVEVTEPATLGLLLLGVMGLLLARRNKEVHNV